MHTGGSFKPDCLNTETEGYGLSVLRDSPLPGLTRSKSKDAAGNA